jgi:hypothetical protein
MGFGWVRARSDAVRVSGAREMRKTISVRFSQIWGAGAGLDPQEDRAGPHVSAALAQLTDDRERSGKEAD